MKHMQLPTTNLPRVTPIRLSTRSCCGLALEEELPSALQARLDHAQYVALAQRVNEVLGKAKRFRQGAGVFFAGLVAIFVVILAGQLIEFTPSSYFACLGLAVACWALIFLCVAKYLLALRKVANHLAQAGYACHHLGVSFRMMWWPWAVYADLHQVDDFQLNSVVVSAQPAAVLNPGQQPPMAPAVYYFAPMAHQPITLMAHQEIPVQAP